MAKKKKHKQPGKAKAAGFSLSNPGIKHFPNGTPIPFNAMMFTADRRKLLKEQQKDTDKNE